MCPVVVDVTRNLPLYFLCGVQGGGDNSPIAATSSTGQQKPKPAPVLPANAGDLFFEYTPAPSDATAAPGAATTAAVSGSGGGGGGGGGSGGKQGGAGAGKVKEEEESNRAPSPGGYTASRAIFVVSNCLFWPPQLGRLEFRLCAVCECGRIAYIHMCTNVRFFAPRIVGGLSRCGPHRSGLLGRFPQVVGRFDSSVLG